MAKNDRQKERLDNMSTGEHLGGTNFGQTPGTNGANHATPEKSSDQNASEDQEESGAGHSPARRKDRARTEPETEGTSDTGPEEDAND